MATTKSETLQTVYLVRHGESTENVRSSPIFEQADAQLTDVGRSQAASIATRATRLSFDALISSSMLRARHTAQAISDATGTEITISDLFVERLAPTSFVGSEWTDEFRARFKQWEQTLYTRGQSMEDGETFDTIIERGKRALEYLSSRPEQSLLVVTHGFFLRVLVGLTMLQDDFVPEDLRRMYKTLVTRNTGITVLIRRSDTPDVWNVLTWNDHAHLG